VVGHMDKFSFPLSWELQNLSVSPVSGLRPEIDDFGDLNGPLLLQNPLEKVGGEAPYLFQWILR
jgi:hypothetical protein